MTQVFIIVNALHGENHVHLICKNKNGKDNTYTPCLVICTASAIGLQFLITGTELEIKHMKPIFEMK